MTWHGSRDEGKRAYPGSSIWMPLCAASQTHHALWLHKHSLAWVWQRRCYQLHRLTHFTLLPRALHSHNRATAAVSAAWQEDIFTTWGLQLHGQKGTPLINTQICAGQTRLCTHACVHKVNRGGFSGKSCYEYKRVGGQKVAYSVCSCVLMWLADTVNGLN